MHLKKRLFKKLFKRKSKIFDTNTKNDHHFYDEDCSKLIDIKNENISINNLPWQAFQMEKKLKI